MTKTVDQKIGMRLTAATMINDFYSSTKQKSKTVEDFIKDCNTLYEWLLQDEEEKGAAGVTQLRPVLN